MNQENDLELDVITSESDGEDVAGLSELPEEEGHPEEPDKEGTSIRRMIPSSLAEIFRKRRLILPLIVLAMAVGFVSAFLLPRISFFGKGPPIVAENLVVPDDFREEKLAPFFIPLSAGVSGKVAVVDTVALWDELTSLRFQKNKHQIRNRLYQFLLRFEEGGADLQEKVSSLQVQMSGLVREFLGIEDLTIRVREIKIY
jgi:hypothetical protein